jgi:6-phosphogluconolactonase
VLTSGSRTIALLLMGCSLAACGGGGDGDGGGGGFSTPSGFTIGGTVSGLTGTGLVLQNNGGNNLTINANGSFTFTQQVQSGSTYNVTVATQPANPTQICSVTSGGGTVANAAVTSVNVTCSGQVARFLYVPNTQSADVSAYSIDANTGALTPIAGSPFETEPLPSFVGADRTGKWLYVSSNGTATEPPTISAYSINATTGVLTELTNSPFELSVTSPPPPGQDQTGKVLVHPTNAFGYVGLRASPAAGGGTEGQLYGATINATSGDLAEIPGFPFDVGVQLGNPLFNAAATVLYVPHAAPAGAVAMYTINAPSGVLTPAGTVSTGGQLPDFAALSPSGKFLMVPNTLSRTLAVFTVDGTSSTLTAVAGSPFLTGGANRTAGLVFHPTKNFVYATNNDDLFAGIQSTIGGFQFDPTTGVLTPIPGSPFSSGGIGANLAVIDPTGKFLYVANRDSDTVQGFAINQISGALTPVPGSPFLTGDAPSAATMDPSGRYLYIPNTNSGSLTSYAINTTSGVLTPVNTVGAGTAPGIAEIVGLQ